MFIHARSYSFFSTIVFLIQKGSDFGRIERTCGPTTHFGIIWPEASFHRSTSSNQVLGGHIKILSSLVDASSSQIFWQLPKGEKTRSEYEWAIPETLRHSVHEWAIPDLKWPLYFSVWSRKSSACGLFAARHWEVQWTGHVLAASSLGRSGETTDEVNRSVDNTRTHMSTCFKYRIPSRGLQW